MNYKDFEDYLIEQYVIEENPLDDMIPDGFNDWLCDLDVDVLIEYGDKYAGIKVKQALAKAGSNDT